MAIYDNGFLNSRDALHRDYQLRLRGLSGPDWKSYATESQIRRGTLYLIGTPNDWGKVAEAFGVGPTDLLNAQPLQEGLKKRAKALIESTLQGPCEVCGANHPNCPEC